MKTVLDSAQDKSASRVKAIHLEIGDLLFLNPEQLEFWMRELFKGTIAQDAEIKMERVKPEIKCSKCDYEGEIRLEDNPLYHIHPPAFFCPKCNTHDVKIARGNECLIRDIEILI